MPGSSHDARPREGAPVLGVFAGGAGRRMGGRDKATLLAPGGERTLLQRWLELGHALELEVVVVGGAARAAVTRLEDAPAGVGPLGGLAPLLAHAGVRPAIAVACDMPYVTRGLLQRLVQLPSTAEVVAPRVGDSGKWEPLLARYDAARVAPVLAAALAEGVRSFQQLLARLDVDELPLRPDERALLRDWDRPEDIG